MKSFRGFLPLTLLYLAVMRTGLALDISVSKDGWGNVTTEEIQKLLLSTAQVFIPCTKKLTDQTIVVLSTTASPRIFYKLSENGAHRISLSAKDRHWCQYAFQFSHELAHLICGSKKGDQTNQWFEESLGEAASLYALLELSKTWETSPPYPSWQSYAKEFKKYRNQRIHHASYPDNFQLSSWYKENRTLLSKNPNLRKQNLWIALNMLGLIEKNPGTAWSACGWLNQSKTDQPKQFEQYIRDWKSACPEMPQKKFVEDIMDLFGIAVPREKNESGLF